MHRIYIFIGRLIYYLLSPVFILALSHRPRTRVVIWNNDKVLLVKSWTGNGKWELPGGGMHKDEKPAEGAVREIDEELNIKITPKDLIFLTDLDQKMWKSRVQLKFFAVEISDSPVIKRQKSEIGDLKWFELTELGAEDIDVELNKIIFYSKEKLQR